MEKILSDGTVLIKARFIRTTCKQCRKEMPKSIIMSGCNFCNKSCRNLWNKVSHKSKPKYGYEKDDGYIPSLHESEESHCDMVEQNY